MLTSVPAFSFAPHQDGSLPLLVGKRKIKRRLQILLGIVLIGHDEVHGINKPLIGRRRAQIQRFDHPKQGLAVAPVEFLEERLIPIPMMGTDLFTLF
jgi:hypothetical protein